MCFCSFLECGCWGVDVFGWCCDAGLRWPLLLQVPEASAGSQGRERAALWQGKVQAALKRLRACAASPVAAFLGMRGFVLYRLAY